MDFKLPAEQSENSCKEGDAQHHSKYDLVANTFNESILILDQVVQVSALTVLHHPHS